MDKLFKVVEIETNNFCNRQCWFCLFSKISKRPLQVMSWELINKIIEELASLNYNSELCWYSINEPLTDARIYNIIEKSRMSVPNCHIRINTNGDLLSEKVISRLFASGLSELRISIYDKDIHDKINDMDFGANNVIKTILYEFNNFNNRSGVIEELNSVENYHHYDCWRPFEQIAIRYDGKMKLCCNDMDGRTFGDYMNLTCKTLQELWYSPEMNKYRETITSRGRKSLPTCQQCNFHLKCNKIAIPI